MSEWQPIETAPKDGTPILVCVRLSSAYAYHSVVEWMDGIGWWNGDVFPENITHWSPLPPLPEEGDR